MKYVVSVSKTYIHKETTIDSKGRLVYEFEKTRVGTIKINIQNGTLQNIGAFTIVKRKLKLNGDRGDIGGENLQMLD